MTILVIGGTGTVGSQVVEGLAQKGNGVRVLSRSKEKAEALPPGIEGVVGDLLDPDSLKAAMKGIEKVFLITPVSPNEAQEGLNAVSAAKQTGIQYLVYLSVHNVHAAAHVPHFASKIEIQKALADSGIPYTVIMPNNFYQNDYRYKEAILYYSIYPQPIGDVGISRVDVRDISDATINSLTEKGHEGKSYPLIGPIPLKGFEVAEIYSNALGRKISYAGNDLEAWSTQAKQALPAWMVHDLKIMYEFFQKSGLVASESDMKEQDLVLHHPPRNFEQFVKETVADWR